jgi:hypothetical protein
MTKGRRKLLWIGLAIPIICIGVFFCVALLNPFGAHEHCIKNSGLALRIYATDHRGKFPADTNGFGNALLVLLREGYLGATNSVHSARLITGPGDDGQLFLNTVGAAALIPEEKCSRIYIQGLSETNNPDIALLFDRKPTRGGDHFRRSWGPLLREVCMVDGSMQVISEEKWGRFASNQVELLVQDGMQREAAQRYYRLGEYRR